MTQRPLPPAVGPLPPTSLAPPDSGGATPRAVKLVAFLMVLELLCGFWTAGMGAVGVLSNGLLSAPVPRIAVAQMVWQVLAAAALLRPLLRRHPTAWAAVEAILVTETAAAAARVVLAVSRGGIIRMSATDLLLIDAGVSFAYLIGIGLLAGALFRARGWYGIGEREGWRTLWKRGWWALVVTGALDLAFLMAVALRGRG